MSALSQKFGLAGNPVERFLIRPITAGGEQMTYNTFLTDYLPRRLEKALSVNERLKNEESDLSAKSPFADAQQTIRDLQEQMAGMSVALGALKKARVLEDFNPDADRKLIDTTGYRGKGAAPKDVSVHLVAAQQTTLARVARFLNKMASRKEEMDIPSDMGERQARDAAELSALSAQVSTMAEQYGALLTQLDKPAGRLAAYERAWEAMTRKGLSPHAQEEGRVAMVEARRKFGAPADGDDGLGR